MVPVARSKQRRENQITVGVDPDIRVVLEREARKLNRSVAGHVRHLISEAMKAQPQQAQEQPKSAA
jgi:hypothetical protein